MTGYIFTFRGEQFTPEGRAEVADPVAHNAALDADTVEYAKQTGRAILYESRVPGQLWIKVSTWAGCWSTVTSQRRYSRHNMAGQDGRLDVWFTGPDGKKWHGVRIGDNQILRCHRLKKQ